ncbi:MAG: ribonuclease P protein component 4 [Candidatus Bathyarchaeia archaeon]
MRNVEVKELARERFSKLLEMAHVTFSKDPEMARRYVEIALNIAEKANLRPPPREKLRICKSCFTPMIPGVTGRIRIRPEHGSKLVITCLECGHVRRIPISKRKG